MCTSTTHNYRLLSKTLHDVFDSTFFVFIVECGWPQRVFLEATFAGAVNHSEVARCAAGVALQRWWSTLRVVVACHSSTAAVGVLLNLIPTLSFIISLVAKFSHPTFILSLVAV